MDEWIAVGAMSSVALGQVLGFEIEGRQLAVYNVDGKVYATDDECTHGYALLSEGSLERECIECPLHGGCFNVTTGKALELPADEDLRTYPVRIVGTTIEIKLR